MIIPTFLPKISMKKKKVTRLSDQKASPDCCAQSIMLSRCASMELEQFFLFARPSTPIVPNCALTPQRKAVAVAAESGV